MESARATARPSSSKSSEPIQANTTCAASAAAPITGSARSRSATNASGKETFTPTETTIHGERTTISRLTSSPMSPPYASPRTCSMIAPPATAKAPTAAPIRVKRNPCRRRHMPRHRALAEADAGQRHRRDEADGERRDRDEARRGEIRVTEARHRSGLDAAGEGQADDVEQLERDRESGSRREDPEPGSQRRSGRANRSRRHPRPAAPATRVRRRARRARSRR